jgi:hypothetical protein
MRISVLVLLLLSIAHQKCVGGIDLLLVKRRYKKDKISTFTVCSVCDGDDLSTCTEPVSSNWYVSGKCVIDRLDSGEDADYEWARFDNNNNNLCSWSTFSDPDCLNMTSQQTCDEQFPCDWGNSYEIFKNACIEVESINDAAAPYSVPLVEQMDFESPELCFFDGDSSIEYEKLIFPSSGCYPSLVTVDNVPQIGSYSVACLGDNWELRSFKDDQCSDDNEIVSERALYEPQCSEVPYGGHFRKTKGCSHETNGTTTTVVCRPESIGMANSSSSPCKSGTTLLLFFGSGVIFLLSQILVQ